MGQVIHPGAVQDLLSIDMTDEIPQDVRDWIGRVAVVSEAVATVERGAIEAFASAVEDANPLYWDDAAAQAITGGVVVPPAMLSAWTRPNRWSPAGKPMLRPLELHFRVKDQLGLPNAIVTEASTEYRAPARPGDRIHTEQMLDFVGPLVENRLGRGRNWSISIYYRRADNALLAVETLGFFGYEPKATT